MKPKHSCTECQAELRPGDRICNKCGAEIEWPEFGGKAKKGSDASAQQKQSQGSVVSNWKTIGGVALFIVAGAVVIDLVMNPKSQPQPSAAPQQPGPTMAAPNMQVMPQIEELERKLAANPDDQQSMLQLANLLHDHRFFDRAVTYYAKFLEKNPKDPNARVDLGICYFELDKLDDAQKAMERALKEDPKHLQAHFNLGMVNLKAGKLKESNEWFKKTVALSPTSDIGKQAQQFLMQHSNPQNLQTK
ncbi:MAG: tetratricopeptide repeat protein [bacterium]